MTIENTKKRIKKIWRGYWHYLVIFFMALIFFLVASSFNYFTQSYGEQDFVKWASPDETANYTFAKLYAQTGQITMAEENNLLAHDIIKPRSVRSDNGVLKPVSFLGIILIYGKIASLTTYKIIPYLTPFFAAIGLFYFYALVKNIFGKNNALISTSLLAMFPVYIYYSARSMFHNVLFTVLLVIGLYYLVAMNKRKMKIKKEEEIWHFCTRANWRGLIYAALAGLAIGLAISARSSESLWVGPVLVLLYLFNIRRTGLIKVFIFLAAFVLALMPTFYYNQLLYGSFYFGGYPEMNTSIINIKDASGSVIQSSVANNFHFNKELFSKIKNNILVFGLHPRQAMTMFKYYFMEMFPWIFWPAIFGIALYISNWRRYKYRIWVFSAGLALTAIILVLYYGSWTFFDNPNRANHTIGNSYTRYWLPIYLGVLPFISLLLIRLTRVISRLFKKLGHSRQFGKFFSWRINRHWLHVGLRLAAIIAVFYWSVNFLLGGSEEGLIYLARRQQEAKVEWRAVMDATENNSVLITMYGDKLFFPERKIIMGQFNDQNMNVEYKTLVNILPVYYYNFSFQPADLDYLNNTRLANVGLQIKEIKKVTDKFTLYQLYNKPEDDNKKEDEKKI
jgi:hypothetical protein